MVFIDIEGVGGEQMGLGENNVDGFSVLMCADLKVWTKLTVCEVKLQLIFLYITVLCCSNVIITNCNVNVKQINKCAYKLDSQIITLF